MSPAGLSLKTRFTRAMACMRPWPCIGLSTYIVCMQGASKPVSHISRTITSLSGSDGSFARFARIARRAGHDNLHGPLRVVGAVPVRPELRDGVVERHADAAAHAHDHAFT